MTTKIFRIELRIGKAGYSKHCFYADILETHYMKALTAARQGRVGNWKWEDTWGEYKRDYRVFRYIGIVDFNEAENPMPPLEEVLENWNLSK
jgi:hypothetical protein